MPPLPALPGVQPGTMIKITKASAASGAGGGAGEHERVLAGEGVAGYRWLIRSMTFRELMDCYAGKSGFLSSDKHPD